MYGNPYYHPYWESPNELEHYGVKGMKWGVRHEDKPTGRGLKRRSKRDSGNRNRNRTNSETMAQMTKRSHDILKEQVSYPYDNKNMQYALDVYNYKARQIYHSKKGWDIDPKTGEWIGTTKEEDEKLMQDAYAQVAETYTDLERAMLALYAMIKEWGMTDRFCVVFYGDTTSESPSLGLYDLQKKDVVPTLEEAQKRMRLDKKSSRRREVDPNAKPVRPKKSEQPADIGTTANPYFLGTVDPLKALNADKKLKHFQQGYSDDYLQHYGVLGMKWGIRRYQNKDGTLTAAGKKRYANDTPEQIERSERRKAKVVKAAKVTASVAAVTAASLLGVSALGNRAGTVQLGTKAVSQLIDAGVLAGREASKLMSSALAREGSKSLDLSNWASSKNPYYKAGPSKAQQDLLATVVKYELDKNGKRS